MSPFLLIIWGVFALDLAWAIVAVRLARRLPGRRGWIALNLIFVGAQLSGLLAILLGRFLRMNWERSLPKFAISAVLLWHLLGLGLLLLGGTAALIWGWARRCLRPPSVSEAAPPSPGLGVTSLAAPAAPAPISRPV